MRKTTAVAAATGTLLFGGAGVAQATVSGAPAPSSTTTTLAQDSPDDNGNENTGLWGLLGLLGLGGLMGLKRRDEHGNRFVTAGTARDTGGATGTGRV